MFSSSSLTAAAATPSVEVWESPIGSICIIATDRGIRRIEFLDALPERPAHGECSDATGQRHVARAKEQLAEYFASERRIFDLPLDLPGTPFQRSVWDCVRRVPYGQTISYRALAAAAARPAAIRAAGAANGANPIAIVIPCHRIIGSNGSLTGYAGGLARKRYLLDLEANPTSVAV
jgi:methylated-DNA-[protein]-cysteine S-methyltransferase